MAFLGAAALGAGAAGAGAAGLSAGALAAGLGAGAAAAGGGGGSAAGAAAAKSIVGSSGTKLATQAGVGLAASKLLAPSVPKVPAAATAAEIDQQAKAKLKAIRGGSTSTIFTSSQGLTNSAPTRKVLLGN